MQLHQIVVVLHRQYIHWPHKVGTCVVNEDVDLTEAIAYLLHHLVNLGAIGDITGNSQHLSTALIELDTRPFELCAIAGTNCQTHSLLHQLARHNQTKSARTTRKQHSLPCEIVLTFAPRSHHPKH